MRLLASYSTLLLSSPGFCGTPLDIFTVELKVPIKMSCLVTQMQAPPWVLNRINEYFFQI